MVCMAEGLVVQQDAAIQRRRKWLEEIDTYHEDAEENSAVQLCGSQVDKYGVDLDVFKNKTGKKPHGWRIFLVCLLFGLTPTAHLRPQIQVSSESCELSYADHHQPFHMSQQRKQRKTSILEISSKTSWVDHNFAACVLMGARLDTSTITSTLARVQSNIHVISTSSSKLRMEMK